MDTDCTELIPIGEPVLTKEKVTELFKLASSEKELYDLAHSFLVMKSHCHLVLFNKDVLEILKPSFAKFLPAYKLSFPYAFTTLYTEECIMKTNIKESDRMVCDIDTAHNLPFFPYLHSDIHQNPYMPLFVSADSMKLDMNLHGLAMIKQYQDYGIDNLEGFKKKFNIFTTSRIDKCIFDGLETDEKTKRWKYFAVGGSVIPSCSMKRHPLIDMVTTSNLSYAERWTRFFNEYHNESDIDMMCNRSSVYEFMDEVKKLKDVVVKNLNEMSGKDISKHVEVEPIKSLAIVINEKYIIECMPGYTVDQVANNIDSDEIKELFYHLYISKKASANSKLRKAKENKNPLYEHFFRTSTMADMKIILTTYESLKVDSKNTDSEFYMYWNDVSENKVPVDQNIMLLKIMEGIKFKIKSPHMLHNIEVFRTKYPDYFSCVSRFHLPCVRGYFTGDNVYLLPSCIGAMMTFTNIEYKYFAGSRDPIEIFNKGLQKGYGTIFNDKEKAHFIEYNSGVTKWQDIFGLNKSKSAIKDLFAPKQLGNSIFKPGKFFQGFPDDVYKVPAHQYVVTMKDLYDVYKTQYKYDAEKSAVDLLKFKAINKDGYLEPLRMWLFDAAYYCLASN